MYTSKVEYDRDLLRALTQLSSRGVTFVTLDLPALEKLLHRSLDEGRFTPAASFLSGKRNKRTGIPVFLESLYKRIFSLESGALLESPCPDAIQALKTIFSFAKKVRLKCPKEREDEAIKAFINTDENLPDPYYNWDSDDFSDHVLSTGRRDTAIKQYFPASGSELSNSDLDIIQRTFNLVASVLGLAPSQDVAIQDRIKPRHGPGAVSEQRNGSSKYNLENWPDRLQYRFPIDFYGRPSLGATEISSTAPMTNNVLGSRLISVPKTMKAPRLIAAEPIHNQWIQQFLWRSLKDRIDNSMISHSISFNDQEGNQRLALEASHTCSHATIDLSEASDRVSLALVESFFTQSKEWLIDLQACRSPFVTLPCGADMRYKKFAPMGSSVTFPLQSLIFFSLCLASIFIQDNVKPSLKAMRRETPGIRVFGDDIIIKTGYVGILVKVLHHVGLKVNTEKSFWTGKFRESCGIDAYDGWTVSAPRILEVPTGNLAQAPSLVETSNNFYKHGYWNTAEYIRSYLNKFNKFIRTKRSEGDALSYFTYHGDAPITSKSRYNKHLHRYEYRLFGTRVKMIDETIEPYARLLQYFIEDPDPNEKWASGTAFGYTISYRVGWLPQY